MNPEKFREFKALLTSYPDIELIPAEIIVRLDMRELLACTPCEGELERAPLGDKVISGGIYGSTLVASMIVKKYDHGMPLHRQREELLRMGLDMPSASASDQIQWATDLLRPLWHEAQQQVLHAKLMQLDATSLPVRDKEHGFGIQLGSLCAYIGDGEVAVYLYASTGKKNGQRFGELGPEDFLAMRKGNTMADASNAFDQSFLRPELTEIGCNTHARRGFIKAIESKETPAIDEEFAKERGFDSVFDSTGSTNTGVPFVLFSKDAPDLTVDVEAALKDSEPKASAPPVPPVETSKKTN